MTAWGYQYFTITVYRIMKPSLIMAMLSDLLYLSQSGMLTKEMTDSVLLSYKDMSDRDRVRKLVPRLVL